MILDDQIFFQVLYSFYQLIKIIIIIKILCFEKRISKIFYFQIYFQFMLYIYKPIYFENL